MKRIDTAISTLLPYLLIVAVVALRLVPGHPGNLIPLFSCILFFGAMRSRREFVLPMVLLVATDAILTTRQFGYVLTADHAVSWVWYAVVLFSGSVLLGAKSNPVRAGVMAMGSAVGFFLLSNFAVWAIWQMYPHTASGLAACYIAALPFFRNSFVAEGVASMVLFALPVLGKNLLATEARAVARY